MAIEFIRNISEVEIDGLNLTEVYIDGVRIHYQPYVYDYDAGNICYKLVGVREGETLSSDLTLPTVYDRYYVKAVGENAFLNRTDLRSVTLPEGYTAIDSYAFKGSSIETLRLPENLTQIGIGAFEGTAVKNVYSPSLKAWLDLHFSSGSSKSNPLNGGGARLYVNNELLTQLTIPEGVETIKNYAFYGYKNLILITLPEGLKIISTGALVGTGITSIEIPSTVTSLGQQAFYNSSLISVKFAEGSAITTIPMEAFSLTPITSINIPDKVTQIARGAFRGCESLPFIELPEGVKTLADNAFKNCSALKGIVIPESIETINAGAFSGAGLEKVYYKGTKNEWSEITIDSADNGALTDATRLYYSEGDPVFNRPNYWHYVNGVPTAWKDDCTTEGHDWQDATCTTPKTCATCGAVEGEALGHDYIYNPKQDPTCTEDGWEAYTTCSRCDYSTERVVIPKLGHSEVTDAAKEPTCTSPGRTEGKHCSNCGEVSIPQTIIPAKGHTFTEWTESEDTPGVKIRSCTVCGYVQRTAESADGALLFTLNEDKVSYTVSAKPGAYYNGKLTIPTSARAPSGPPTNQYPVTRVGKIGGEGLNPTAAIIPSSIKKIDPEAFKGCKELKHVRIDAESLDVGEGAFSDCPFLRYIYYKGTATQWSKATGSGATDIGSPHAVVCYYSATSPTGRSNYWYYHSASDVGALIWPNETIYDFIETTIAPTSGGRSYSGYFIKVKSGITLGGVQALPQIYNGRYITGIAPFGFYTNYQSQTKLKGLIIPDTYKVIGDGALAYCSDLGSVFIPKSIEYIGEGAFHLTTPESTPTWYEWKLKYSNNYYDNEDDPDNDHLYLVPEWYSVKHSAVYPSVTNLYFEATEAGELWDSAWTRGMSHGVTTQPSYYSYLYKKTILGGESPYSNSDLKDLGTTWPDIVTRYFGRKEMTVDGVTIWSPATLYGYINANSIKEKKVETTTNASDRASICTEYVYAADGEISGFYLWTAYKEDSEQDSSTFVYFTLVRNMSGSASLKLTANKETRFKLDRGAIITELGDQTYWLGINNPFSSTNLGLYKGDPHGLYVERGTKATWGCSPSGDYIVKGSEISGSTELNASADVLNIPDTINGTDITTIADGAFSGAVATGASIGNNITTIGGRAFSGTKLQSIKIPLSVEVIKSGAFAGCKGIKIYCAAVGKPDGWADDWCDSDAEIVWCYCENHVELTTVIEPTCDTAGGTIHYCESCGYSYTTDITAPLEHDWKTGATVQPTCEAQGYTRRSCKKCGTVSGTNYVDALGHLYKQEVKKPSCTSQGWTEYTCSRTGCSDWYRDDYTEPLGHIESDWDITKQPTSTEHGWRQKYCTRCTAILVKEKIPALGCASGHSYKATSTTAPTCEADGYTTYTCELCGDTYTGDFEPSLGHDTNGWEVVTQPTCITEGLRRTVCQTCGLVEEQKMEPIPGAHKYQLHANVEPTCEGEGFVIMKCSVCGYEDTQYKDALGHDWDTEVEVVYPTCGSQGYTIHTCNACGETKHTNYTDPTGLHTWGEWNIIIPPDCMVEGEEKCTCQDCDAVWTSKIPMTDHTPSDWIIDKEPTTEEEGLKHKDCTICGQYLGSNTIPKLEATDQYLLTESGDYLTTEDENKLIIEGD
jgi:hypothetical protein